MITLRVQQGDLRGQKIRAPAGLSGQSRFTPAVVKDAVFQILSASIRSELERWTFFDLCAGSGQMALEAVSVGFGAVHLCEIDDRRLRYLRSQFQGRYPIQVHRRDFRRMASPILRSARSAIFIDMPYSFWQAGKAPALDRFLFQISHPAEEPICTEHILLIIQGPNHYDPNISLCGNYFSVERRFRKQRGICLSFLKFAR